MIIGVHYATTFRERPLDRLGAVALLVMKSL